MSRKFLDNYLEKTLIFKDDLINQSSYSLAILDENLQDRLQAGTLMLVGEGIYAKPHKTAFGVLGPSMDDIIKSYTANCRGMLIGYDLYNKLGISTQISKRCQILSNRPQPVLYRDDVVIQHCNIIFDAATKAHVAMLEILTNWETIQDFNELGFESYCEKFFKYYFNPEVLESVLKERLYSSTVVGNLVELPTDTTIREA